MIGISEKKEGAGLYRKVLDAAASVENNRIFSSIKKGFILLIPVLMIGAIALMLRSFPAEGFQSLLKTAADGVFLTILNYIYDSTFGFLSAYLVLSISFYYSMSFPVKNLALQVMAMLAAFASFVASFGAASGGLTIENFGPTGVFTAILCAIISTKLFYLLSIRLFEMRHFHAVSADINYRSSIIAIVPFLCCILVFVGINLLINAAFHVSSFNALIEKGLVELFRNISGNLAGGILFVIMLNLLWFFGIHGGNAMDQVAQTVFAPAGEAQGMIVSKTFLDNFALIGGCGTAICLLLALLIAARTRGNRKLAWSAAPTVVFNINEMLVYGLPVVLNPMMLIPFLLVPLCSLLIGYGATASGLVPMITQSVTWTTPPFLSGYLATGSVWGAVVQGVIVAVGTLIYIPFVRLSEQMQQKREGTLVAKMMEYYTQCSDKGEPCRFLERHDDIGSMARAMLNQLRADIDRDRIPLFYQPQMDEHSKVVGAEALLRWQYAGNTVAPPLVVALAQEDGLYGELTSCILRRAQQDIRQIGKQAGREIPVAVNVTAGQLNDEAFLEEVIRTVREAGIAGQMFLEVTEESSVNDYSRITQNIERLNQNGIAIAIDDFSMGQTSLKYLQTNRFDSVKLDGSLVRKITENPRSQEIIRSIVHLGTKLGFKIVAEYVETEEIRQALLALGCRYFQGYLFSPAIPREAFVDYLKAH